MNRTIALCLAVGFPVIGTAQITVSVSYTFDGPPENQLAATASSLYLDVSDFSYGEVGDATSPGITATGNLGNAFEATHWHSSGDYYSITVGPAMGYALSFDSFSFDARVTNSGPQVLSLYSGHNGFSDPIASFTNESGETFATYATGLSSIVTATSPTEFRVFGAGATSWQGKFHIDNLAFTGTISAVPEPSTYGAWMGLGVFALLMTKRLRNAQS